MFVSRKKYRATVAAHEIATHLFEMKYNALMQTSVEMLKNAQLEIARLDAQVTRQARGSEQFTPEEIKTLITLCHPDKHGGKESAQRITQKLLSLRK